MTGKAMSSPLVRPIAFYLPQFHPIPENDAWWGKGFTEWTNVTRARRCSPATTSRTCRPTSASTICACPRCARRRPIWRGEYGIHGFCYYHYWFNGKRLLERPFDEVLRLRPAGLPVLPVLGQRELDAALGWPRHRGADRSEITDRRTIARTAAG